MNISELYAFGNSLQCGGHAQLFKYMLHMVGYRPFAYIKLLGNLFPFHSIAKKLQYLFFCIRSFLYISATDAKYIAVMNFTSYLNKLQGVNVFIAKPLYANFCSFIPVNR